MTKINSENRNNHTLVKKKMLWLAPGFQIAVFDNSVQ